LIEYGKYFLNDREFSYVLGVRKVKVNKIICAKMIRGGQQTYFAQLNDLTDVNYVSLGEW